MDQERCSMAVGNVVIAEKRSLNFLLNQLQEDQFIAKSVGPKEDQRDLRFNFSLII